MRYEQNQSSKRLDNRSRFLPARIHPKADEPKSFDFLPSACSKSSYLPSVTLLSQRHTRREQSIAQRHTRLQAPNLTSKAIFCEKGNPSTPNQKKRSCGQRAALRRTVAEGAPPLLRPNAARTEARYLCVPPAEPCAPLGAGQRVSSAPFGSLRLAVVSPFCAPAACVVGRLRVGRAVRLVRSPEIFFCADCKGVRCSRHARRRSRAQTPPAPGRAISASRPLSLAPLWARGRELVPRPSGHCGWRSCLRSARPAACVVDRVRVGRAVRLVRSAVSLFCADCKGYPPSYGAFGALWSVPPSHPEGLSGERARAKNACAVLAVVQQRTRVGSAP